MSRRIFHRIGLMDVAKLCLRFWGGWPSESVEDGRSPTWYKNSGTFAMGSYILFNISQIIQCVRLFLDRDPYDRISKCVSVVITTVMMIWKLLIYRRNGIPEKCVEVMKSESRFRCDNDPDVRTLYANLIRKNNWMNFWTIGTASASLAAFIGVSFVELIEYGPGFWQDESTVFMHELYLPLLDRQRASLLLILTNITLGIMSVILNAAIQTTFFALIFYAILRFQVLRCDLKKLGSTTESTSVALKQILNDHRELISFVENLNEATKSVLLMSYLLNSIKVAAVLVQVIAIGNITLLLFPIFYSSMLISEVVLIGWMCNEIKEESLTLAKAAYDTAWYDESKNVKMMISLMICRAQKPLTMTIGPFGPMTTSTIVTTLHAAYTYAALMIE